jgi:pectinesterase
MITPVDPITVFKPVRCLFGIVLAWLLAGAAWSAEVAKPKMMPLNPAFQLPDNVTMTRDVVYATVGSRKLHADVFQPKAGAGPFPAIVYFYGWAPRVEGLTPQFWRQAAYMATKGYVGICVEYRIRYQANYPAAIWDAKAAVRWTRANAERYQIDPNRIGAAGGSGGGFVVGMLGTTGDLPELEGTEGNPGVSSRVAAVAAFNPAVNWLDVQAAEDALSPEQLTKFFGTQADKAKGWLTEYLGASAAADPERWRRASPTNRVSATSAPFLFLHGDADVNVPYRSSVQMAEKLREAGVRAEIFTAPGVGHGFFNVPPWYEPSLKRMAEFFDTTLGAASGAGVGGSKAVARQFLAAVSAADESALRALLAPTVQETLVIAGVYSPEFHAFPGGTQWNREGLVAKDLALAKAMKDGFALKAVSMMSEGDGVAAEVIGDGVRTDSGRRYFQHYSFHWQVTGGQIRDIRVYEDTLEDWNVWCNAGAPVTPVGATAEATAAPEADPVAPPASEPRPGNPEENQAIVRRFLRSVPTGNSQLVLATWAPDGRWSFALGGDYLPRTRTFAGAPHWTRDAMIRMQSKGQKNLKEPLVLDVTSVIAEGDQVCAEAIGVLVRPNGRAYRQHYSFHFKLRGGRIEEGHVYQDTLHQYDVTLKQPDSAPVAAPLEHGSS